MKILITGVNGRLGYDIAKQLLQNKDIEVVGIGTKTSSILANVNYYQIDITKRDEVFNFIKVIQPNIIIHCAAYTNLDKAEEEPDIAFQINYNGTKNLVEAAKEIDSVMVYISTDAVFNDKGNIPWSAEPKKIIEDCVNIYGKSKLAGENIVSSTLQKYFIIRTFWVFGINGNNFIKMMIQQAKEKKFVNVVNDQFGLPTYTVDLAKLIIKMIKTDKYGYYNATNSGKNYINQYEFCQEIYKQINANTEIYPISSDQYPRKAKRLKNSRLDLSKLTEMGFEQLPDWKDALSRYLKELNIKGL